MIIKLKRVYAEASADDGQRILVERLWPRGVKKERAALDLWLKDVAPSPELRTWFAHDPAKWEEFRQRYYRELDGARNAVARLCERLARGPVTLICSSRDEQHNAAVALKEYLERTGDCVRD
jgi:uncharacterized protein YeaO (DUF488 family)